MGKAQRGLRSPNKYYREEVHRTHHLTWNCIKHSDGEHCRDCDQLSPDITCSLVCQGIALIQQRNEDLEWSAEE